MDAFVEGYAEQIEVPAAAKDLQAKECGNCRHFPQLAYATGFRPAGTRAQGMNSFAGWTPTLRESAVRTAP
jgi:hypothetical protein